MRVQNAVILAAVVVLAVCAGSYLQRDHDRACLQTDTSWSTVMGCIDGATNAGLLPASPTSGAV